MCLTKGEKPADGTLCGDGHNYVFKFLYLVVLFIVI
jgi:hypothetical protein